VLIDDDDIDGVVRPQRDMTVEILRSPTRLIEDTSQDNSKGDQNEDIQTNDNGLDDFRRDFERDSTESRSHLSHLNESEDGSDDGSVTDGAHEDGGSHNDEDDSVSIADGDSDDDDDASYLSLQESSSSSTDTNDQETSNDSGLDIGFLFRGNRHSHEQDTSSDSDMGSFSRGLIQQYFQPQRNRNQSYRSNSRNDHVCDLSSSDDADDSDDNSDDDIIQLSRPYLFDDDDCDADADDDDSESSL
jgi:hypothetical protein